MSTIKHTSCFSVDQEIDFVFPLFSAEGEKLWVPGWAYENVMDTTDLREDYVFLTTDHNHAAVKAIWLTKRYEPESYFVEFYKVEPESKVGIISIQCSRKSGNSTNVKVSYKYIGLSNKGNEFVKKFTFQEYKIFIDEWKRLLLKYFNTRQITEIRPS